ncbi:MAG TPA: hypothetical protein VK689_08860, partial [Armatimonadota bacterium]|nr:hypothetical protein [Armatimonadota bacterium]
RTSSATESGKLEIDPKFQPSLPVQIELHQRYHCELRYDGPSRVATLLVTDPAGKTVAARRLEDLKDFTSNVSWFGVSVRGYNRFDKKLEPIKAAIGYVRPMAKFTIENLEYRQP